MKKLILMMAVLGLAACARPNETQKTATLKPNVITYDVPATYLHETRLADGTRCVYAYGISLTCEWKPVVVVSQAH